MASVGYATLRVVPSLKGMAGEINRELNQSVGPATKQMAEKAGAVSGVAAAKQFAGEFSDWSAKQLRRSMIGVAGVASGVLATSLVKGFGRLRAIDDAQAKLRGLGHDTQSVAGIMDSALASVRGTMFGLGEAASISATAVAAGVKPGEELTRYLKLIADTSTIAGVSLSEMGSIINKTTTDGRVFTMELRQLADRGVPIFTWLADAYGVSTEALRGMVEQGKVDAETFRRVIEENIGGAALAAGDSFSGAMANAGHAAGRFGAVLLEDVFPLAQRFFNLTIEGFDVLSARVRPAMDRITDTQMWRSFAGSIERLPGLFERAADAADRFADAVVWVDEAHPALRGVGVEGAKSAVAIGALAGAASLLRKPWTKLAPVLAAAGKSFATIGAVGAKSLAGAVAGVSALATGTLAFGAALLYVEDATKRAEGPLAQWLFQLRNAGPLGVGAAAGLALAKDRVDELNAATREQFATTPGGWHAGTNEAAQERAAAMAEAAAARTAAAASRMTDALEAEQKATADFLADFSSSANDFVTGFAALPEQSEITMQEWIDNMTSRTEAFRSFWKNIASLQALGLTALADELVKEGPAVAGNLTQSFVDALESGDKSIAWMAEQAARLALSESDRIGLAMSEGAANGLRAGMHLLSDAAVAMVTTALRTARSEARIESPSKVFRDLVGKPIGEGVAVGIASQFATVGAAAGGLVDGALSAALSPVRTMRIPVAGYDAPALAPLDAVGAGGGVNVTINNPTGEPSEESLTTAVLGLQVGGFLDGPA